ncbi:MAG: acyltransferase family protein [Clostridia bacterium]|nr:acyltransferase family protein [Clostridia bacterium]
MENCNTLNNRPQRNLWIDIFRILLSLLVVGLHTVGTGTPLTQVYRFAVPAFFIISGFYAYCPDENKSVEKSKRFVKSTLQYFAIGFVIYTILIIIRTAVVGDNVRDFSCEIHT